ncbi:MAG: hypothetical protein S4CHLAM81_06970 [Chlamydiales bacterium]|nr:hypothetical protein [Chlamydiales bacterium]MCH9635481.1 hypothetical protein [Chlamydiales bacterium]MCH9704017.1 hypothetical protein [Chlamydiota bacterium]
MASVVKNGVNAVIENSRGLSRLIFGSGSGDTVLPSEVRKAIHAHNPDNVEFRGRVDGPLLDTYVQQMQGSNVSQITFSRNSDLQNSDLGPLKQVAGLTSIIFQNCWGVDKGAEVPGVNIYHEKA